MTDQALSNSPAVLATNHSFLVALLAAVIVHIILLFSVQAPKPTPAQFSRSIDITIVDAPTTKTPEKSQFLAEDNQLASGEQNDKPEPIKQPAPEKQKPIPTPPLEKIKPLPQIKPMPKTAQIKPMPPVKPIPKLSPEKIKPVAQEKPIEESLPPVDEPEVEQKIITQQHAEQKIVTRSHSTINNQSEKRHPISAASLQQQITEMGTEISQQPASEMQTKRKSVNQVSANKYVAAQYLKDWETKVERTGNNNYPAAATKAGFSATLTMDVGIKSDGSIDSIRITHSSGNPELDEQAKNIVRMSAPFPPLPVALRSELDVLVITRSWKFSDESGLITQ